MTDSKKPKKISHSAWKKYHECPTMYKLHYNDRIRPSQGSSSLIFGLAIDEALNALLTDDKKDPVIVFQENFTWEMCRHISWHDSDLDYDLFNEKQMQILKIRSHRYANWACMRIKGRLMIEAYIREVLPLIEEVHDVQLETRGRKGYIDAILSLKGFGKVLCDHKTTARPYKRGSVAGSTQLALYAGQEGLSTAAFITLNKQIRKNKQKTCRTCGNDGTGRSHKTCPVIKNGERCNGTWRIVMDPQAFCQIIVDRVPKENIRLIEESITETEEAIASGTFPKNLSHCESHYGKRCPYFDFCRSGEMRGLEKVESDSK